MKGNSSRRKSSLFEGFYVPILCFDHELRSVTAHGFTNEVNESTRLRIRAASKRFFLRMTDDAKWKDAECHHPCELHDGAATSIREISNPLVQRHLPYVPTPRKDIRFKFIFVQGERTIDYVVKA